MQTVDRTRTLLNQLSWSVNPGQLHYLYSGQPARQYSPPYTSLPPPAPPNLPHHDKYTQTIVEDIKQSILVLVLGSVWLILFVFLAIFCFLPSDDMASHRKPKTEVVGVCNSVILLSSH